MNERRSDTTTAELSLIFDGKPQPLTQETGALGPLAREIRGKISNGHYPLLGALVLVVEGTMIGRPAPRWMQIE